MVLLPAVEVVAARERARSQNGYTRWQVDELYDGFSNGTPRIGLWLDTSTQTPADTVTEILGRASDAEITT